MRSVTAEEGSQCLKNLLAWAASDQQPSGGSLGEWVYRPMTTQDNPVEVIPEGPDYMLSLTPSAAQRVLGIYDKPYEYPCTPQEVGDDPLVAYVENLQDGAVFFRGHNGPYLVVKSGFSADGQSLCVMTKAGYVWKERGGEHVPVLISELSDAKNDVDAPLALTKVTYEDGLFVHEKMDFGFHPKEYVEKEFAEYTRPQ
jgi:hypothetical protein